MLGHTSTSQNASNRKEWPQLKLGIIILVLAGCSVFVLMSHQENMVIGPVERVSTVTQVALESGRNKSPMAISARSDCNPAIQPSAEICIPSRIYSTFGGHDFGSYVVRTTGLISAIKLTFVSGEMKFCGAGSGPDCRGRWGATRADLGFNVYVTRDDAKSLIFPTGGVVGISGKSYGCYLLPGSQSVNGDTFVMNLGSQFHVSEGEVLRFYTAEVFNNEAWGDNVGQTCANVEITYDLQTKTTVCIPGKGLRGNKVEFAYGALVAPQSGVLSGITLTKTSGSLNYCNPNDANCRGTFGSVITDFQMYVTRANPKNLIIPTGGTQGLSPGNYWGYKLASPGAAGMSANSLTINLPQQRITQFEQLRFYVGEALYGETGGTYGDNSGQMCVDVALNFQTSSMICIPAKPDRGYPDAAFGSFVVRQDGLVSSIKLTYVSGEMKYCGAGSAPTCKGRWGATHGAPAGGHSIYITKESAPTTLIYPTSLVKGIVRQAYETYKIPGSQTVNGDTFTMNLGFQLNVKAGDVLRFYTGEVYANVATGDNVGQTCATVELTYDAEASSEMCIPAGAFPTINSRAYGSYQIQQSGIISSIELTFVSGGMKFCGPLSAADCRGRWGATRADLGYNIYVVRDDGKTLMFPTGGVEGITKKSYGCYRLPGGLNVDSTTFVINFGSQYSVTQGEILRFYTAEVFINVAWTDNLDETCANVKVNYDTTTTNRVCISAGDNTGNLNFAAGTILAPRSGILQSMLVKPVSGKLHFCGGPTCEGTIGSQVTDLQIYMTRSDSSKLLMPTGGTHNISSGAYNGYKLDPMPSVNGQELKMFLPQVKVTKGEELRFWTGETLRKSATGDNSGQMCADVTFNIRFATQTCADFSSQTECDNQCTRQCTWDSSANACRCAAAPLDFVFVIDGSGSLDAGEFSVQKQMITDMIEKMVPKGSGIGLLQFSNLLRQELAMIPRQSAQVAVGKVNAMTQLRGMTYIGNALSEALTSLAYLGNSNTRSNTRIVLVTDGQNNGGVEPCSLVTQITQRQGLQILIVGVTGGFSAQQLECLVQHQTNPSSWIVQMPSYSLVEFEKVVPELDAKICK